MLCVSHTFHVSQISFTSVMKDEMVDFTSTGSMIPSTSIRDAVRNS